MEPIFRYELEATTTLDRLPGYDTSHGASALLELARKVQLSENYFYQGIPSPRGNEWQLAGLASFEDRVTVDAGSYLMSICGASYAVADLTLAQPFKVQMFDVGAKTSLFSRTFALGTTFCGELGDSTAALPLGPYYLMGPLVVLYPGALNIQITNLSTIPCFIQMLLNFAVPITRRALGQHEVHLP